MVWTFRIYQKLEAPGLLLEVALRYLSLKIFFLMYASELVSFQGLGALARDRPDDAIQYLADFLLREKHRFSNYNPFAED